MASPAGNLLQGTAALTHLGARRNRSASDARSRITSQPITSQPITLVARNS
jgi:hypothetical protein